MRDVKVGERDGFQGLGEVLKSQQMRRVVESRANTAAMLYQAVVAKQTGRLARDVRVTTRIGGRDNDRWVASVVVGENIEHDLPHEFGHTDGDKKIGGAKNLDQVLKMLASYT